MSFLQPGGGLADGALILGANALMLSQRKNILNERVVLKATMESEKWSRLKLTRHVFACAPQQRQAPLSSCPAKKDSEKKPLVRHFFLLRTFARVPAGALLFNFI
jgi:hypothetical protein